MKNRILASILFLLLISIGIFSQPHRSDDDVMLNPFWDFYSNNYLNTPSAGRGFTGIASMDNDISGVLLNPATVNIQTKAQLNLQYTFKSAQGWLPAVSDNLMLKHQLFSGTAGFGYRINKTMQTGIVYSNPSGYYFDIGKIIRTDEFGNKIGEYDAYYNVTYHNLALPYIFSGKYFQAGLTANLIYSRFSSPTENFTTLEDPGSTTMGSITAASYFSTFQVGVIYNITSTMNIGLTLTTGGKSKVNYKLPAGVSDQSAGQMFPWKAGIGFEYKPVDSKLRFFADYDYSRTSAVSTLKDRHDFHIGVESEINKNWILRGGFFTLLDYRNTTDNTFMDGAHEYDQYFITVGGTYLKKGYKINFALLSSQLSPGKIKNLYINAGMTFDL